MQWHLDEISSQVAPGAHAVLILDQAGWHTTNKLAIPTNITLLPLPPRAPELNPVENIWQFMRGNWLNNRVFKSYDDIVTLCCEKTLMVLVCGDWPRLRRMRDRAVAFSPWPRFMTAARARMRRGSAGSGCR